LKRTIPPYTKGRSGLLSLRCANFRKKTLAEYLQVFAAREKKRRILEERANDEKKRMAEMMAEASEKRKLAEEFAKNYEVRGNFYFVFLTSKLILLSCSFYLPYLLIPWLFPENGVKTTRG